MTLTVNELYKIFYGINALSNLDMQAQTAYKVIKNKKILLDELAIFDELKSEFIDDNNQVTDEAGLQEINDTEVDINLLTIDINEITSNITPNLIELILPILEITEGN